MANEHDEEGSTDSVGPIESLSAVTLVTGNLRRALAFYTALGFRLRSGDECSRLVSFAVGPSYLNLLADADAAAPTGWGRVIIYVTDVDAFYARVRALGFSPEAPPRDAAWGERYFHLRDPDGHELSFAKPLDGRGRA
ncbi:MAG TPA: VOC family protein [Phycisphaerae bacterium]|nr:VOC family protein [Phycisphaerales bacterium]HRX83969.1 VOC family protein [Phycisphaerae bacterium]